MNFAQPNQVLISILLCLALAGGAAMGQSAPTIIQQPLSQTNLQASNTTLSVTAAGPGPFTYQWQLNGTNLPNGVISTMAGGGGAFPGDGEEATNVYLDAPYGLAVDLAGDVFIADAEGSAGRIREVLANGVMITAAGGGPAGSLGDGNLATNASLDEPKGVGVDASGELFIADTFNNRIRKVGTNRIITTIAGNGMTGSNGLGGAATSASLSEPLGLAVDAGGDVWAADIYNYRVCEVTNGLLLLSAGNGSAGYSGNGGAATNATLSQPSGVARDAAGNLYIADMDNNVVRKVNAQGIITTVAGSGTNGYSGDGQAATNAKLKHPYGVAVDANGNLFIADTGNLRIRQVATNGVITTAAGDGGSGYTGDGGPATAATFDEPTCVAVDAYGNLLISDTQVQVVRKVLLQGPAILLNSFNTNVAGKYDVIVTGPNGSVTSSVATITIITPPGPAPQNLTASLAPGPAAVIQWNGAPGTNYVLQAAANLSPPIAWLPISTNAANANGNCSFVDTNVLPNSERFYRVLLP
jgi:hypothetical protein